VSSEPVTDIRPLVVLDLGDYDNRAVTYLRNIANDDRAFDGGPTPRAKLVHLIADQIEAQAKPPRIPEPGLWGVVKASTQEGGYVRRWVRDGGHENAEWVAIEATMRREWDDLIDPVLIREGVES